MRKKYLIMFSFMLIMAFTATTCFADNPIIQTIYTADPAPMVYNDTVYLYTGHDEDNAPSNGFLMKDWRCYTSTDMQNWTDHGVFVDVTAFKWAQQTGNANAGQVIYRNGKFYFYAPVSETSSGGIAIGVGVSNSPLGPFTDALGKPLIPFHATDFSGYATHGWRNLDPTVVIDDGGQAYLYWGNNACYWVKLNSDMISYSGSINYFQLTTAAFGPDYEEAPWLYKHNGLYYLAYASYVPEAIRYSTSTSPAGPWTYRGVIMDVQSGSNGNHPGIIDYKGNSYFFGFNNSLPGGTSYKRSVCVDKITYNSDGTIQSLGKAWSTSGPAQIGTLNPFDQTEAETICWESGVETEKCSEGGMDVCNIENGDYIKVKGVNFSTGATSFNARVASATSGGNIELRLDSPTGTLVGTCAVSGTGGWQTWVTKSCTVSGATGTHDLYLKFTGNSGSLFNFNWWKFNSSSTQTPTPTPTPTPSTATATPTPTPIPGTATPTPTPVTATATPTPTPATATPAPGGVKVQFFNGNTAATTNTIYANFKVVNTGTASINLSDVKMRYYFTNDGTQADSYACDYSTIGAGNVTGSFATITGTNADRYLEVGFTSGAGTLAAGASAEVKGRIWKPDWSNFTQTGDYSFNATATNYVDATTVTGYLAGALKWGTEP